MTTPETIPSNSTMPATIMVAEDDVALRELLIFALETSGFKTVPAGNVISALTLLKVHRLDMILLDLRLGYENGLDILKAVRQMPQYEKLPIILLTACASLDTVRAIAKVGVQGYFLKHQLSRSELIDRIRRQLKGENKEVVAPTEVSRPPVNDQKFTDAAANSSSAKKTVPASSSEKESGKPEAPNAEPGDLLRSIKPILTREQVLEQVGRCAELKAFSPTVAQLLSMTGESDCSLDQIARVIKRDQAIALKVLKIANSVVYSRGSPVETVHQALSRIGLAQVRQLILNISVIDNFQHGELGEDFKSEWFWEHSIATGLLAASITRLRCGDERAIDSAFTMGLLHDVARMMFVEQSGDMYKNVLDTSARLQLPLEHVETRMLLINHADLMDRVLNAWKFPKTLVEPIAMHHLSLENMIKIAPNGVNEVSILALADRLIHAMLLGSSGNSFLYPCEKFVKYLEISPDALRAIQEKIPEQTADMKLAMLQTNGVALASYRDRALKLFGQDIKPLYISANPTIDGFGTLFEHLRDRDCKTVPNVGVMYLAESEEQRVLLESLHRHEEELKVHRLPLILLMTATTRLDNKLWLDRTYRKLTVPCNLSQLAGMINTILNPSDSAP